MSAAARSQLALHSEPAESGAGCFDAALATAPLRELAVADIIDLLHVSHAPEAIAQFRRAMIEGDRFPPVSVVRLLGRYFLADGHKRFSAYATFAPRMIVVEVWSTGRWLQDQWRQLTGKTGQQVTLLARCFTSAEARAQGVRLFWDTIGHWQRVGRSLASRWRRPPAP